MKLRRHLVFNMALIKIKSESMDLADDYAFTGTVSGAGGGITEADQFRLTADTTTTQFDVTSNLERVDSNGFARIGTGITESSGIFSFPSTGIYFIHANVSSNNSLDFRIFTTTDNSTYETATQMRGIDLGNASGIHIFDVTDITTHKVKFRVENNSGTIYGHTGDSKTYFTFIKLGDT